MSSTNHADSVLRGNFCDVVKHFRNREIDDLDRLVQRGVSVLLRTRGKPRSQGDFLSSAALAEMYADEALTIVGRSFRTYPFLRDAEQVVTLADPSLLGHVQGLIGMAEQLVQEPAPSSCGGVDPVSTAAPVDVSLNAFYAGEVLVYNSPAQTGRHQG